MSHSKESRIGCKCQDKAIKEDNIIEPNLVLLLGIMVICHMSYAQLVMWLACGRQHKMAWHGMAKGALDPSLQLAIASNGGSRCWRLALTSGGETGPSPGLCRWPDLSD